MPSRRLFFEDMSDGTPQSEPPSLPDLVDVELANYSQDQRVTLTLVQTLKNEEYLMELRLELYTIRLILFCSVLSIMIFWGGSIYFIGEKINN